MESENTQSVLKETILNLVKDTSMRYLKIKERYPKTADALLFSSFIESGQYRDDWDVLFARQAVMNEDFVPQNTINIVDAEIQQDRGEYLPKKIEVLQKLNDSMLSENPDDLFKVVQKQMGQFRGELLSDKFRPLLDKSIKDALENPSEYQHDIFWRLEKYQGLNEASSELVGSLSKSPSALIEEALSQ